MNLDIFGKKRNNIANIITQEDEPNRYFSTELITKLLVKNNLPTRKAKVKFSNCVVWGDGPGAIHAEFSPLGSYKATIRRMNNDLIGDEIWCCKEIMPMTYRRNDREEQITEEIFNVVQQIDKIPLDYAGRDYDLERLAIKMARMFKKTAPKIFIFQGLRKITNYNYIIYASFRGQGVEAPTRERAIQFDINLSFDPFKGIIKNFGTNIQSPINYHSWQLKPSEWEEFYFPTQSFDEIVNNTQAILSTY